MHKMNGREKKIPRFPFCFTFFRFVESVNESLLKRAMSKKEFEHESNKTLAIWTHQCLNVAIHIHCTFIHNWMGKERWKKISRSMRWTKDERYKNSVKSYETRAYYIHNLKWLFCVFVFPAFVIINWFCLLLCHMPFAI